MAVNLRGEEEVQDKLNKIIWFNSSDEYFNYILVSGSKQVLKMTTEELLIIHHLFLIIMQEKDFELDHFNDARFFKFMLRQALGWASEKQRAMFKKYKPSEEVLKAYEEFNSCKYKYLIYTTNKKKIYKEMVDSFRILYDLL